MWRVYGGAVLVIAGIAAIIDANRHRPPLAASLVTNFSEHRQLLEGWSGTVEDLVHVAGWALIVAGLLLAIMGLIRYSAALRG
jgi:hypothetical protein